MTSKRSMWSDGLNGFGFIALKDGADGLVHHLAIHADDFKFLREGDRVSFDIEQDQKGLAVVNVTVIYP